MFQEVTGPGAQPLSTPGTQMLRLQATCCRLQGRPCRTITKGLELQVVCSCSRKHRLAWLEVQLLLFSLERDRDAHLYLSPLHYPHQIGLWARSLSPLRHPISLAPACYRRVREALSLFQPANPFFWHSGSLSSNETQLTLGFGVF